MAGAEATWIYPFAAGRREWNDLLGGKGANLAEMTRLGLPVPDGFTITTEACRHFLVAGEEPAGLAAQLDEAVGQIEQAVGRRLGDLDSPLLLSVRSGARFSMPGMMDTVLNIGLTEKTLPGLARFTGDARFAWDSYRRLLAMFGETVLGVPGHEFAARLDEAKQTAGVEFDIELAADDLEQLCEQYLAVIAEQSGQPFPQDPREQLAMAIRAVFDSWNTERAQLYRRQERIPDDLGTAVNVQAMVFGNLPGNSGTGVAFTRDPATGNPGNYGDYLPNAQGEDVVAGIRDAMPLTALAERDPQIYRELVDIMAQLEEHYRDLCDIEFTVEAGKLWMLQTRIGKRTAAAAFRIAHQLLREGRITTDEALQRVTGAQLAQLMYPQFEDTTSADLLTRGISASPGAAVGEVVLDSATAVTAAAEGRRVVLVRRETNPDDLPGMVAAAGILTSRGGKTSHAAVVARGLGRTAVCGANALQVDMAERQLIFDDGRVVGEGEVISLNGSTGEVFAGEVPVRPSAVVRYFDEGIDAAKDGATTDTCELVDAVDALMGIADATRGLGVRANADTPTDAARARRMGAGGIGLCRTEHMFLGERKQIVQRMILAEDEEQRQEAFDELLPLQRKDFVRILEAMDGMPVTIRLLDPPLHEFLPDYTELSVRVALAEQLGEPVENDLHMLAAVRRMHEDNPMLGLRGVRLGLVLPGLFALQVRAIAEAACFRQRIGGDPRAEIMIPLVGSVQELELVTSEASDVLADVAQRHGCTLEFPIGTMIELPRAALTADQIAGSAHFFSFGTNDLTQTTWGFSRDDVEGAFFAQYLERGVFGVSPFESIDRAGVGRLVEMASAAGRAVRPDLALGVCGEHGGDPDSIHFFHDIGLDYVSCSPFRVPVARLEAGRAAIAEDT
jgi:pyruvate,orthophosphate dikinase